MSDSGFDPADLFGLRRRPGGRPRMVRPGPRLTRPRRILIAVAVLLVVLVTLFLGLLGLRVQYLFLDNLGHSNVFWTPIATKALCFLVGFVVVGGLVALNIRGWVAAGRTVDEAMGRRVALFGGIAIAVIAGFAGGSYLESHWEQVLLYTHRHDFGQSEPVFGLDYGYFIFSLPFYDTIQGMLWGGVITGLLVTIGAAALCAAVEYVPDDMPVPLRPPKGVSPLDGLSVLVRQAGMLLVAVFLLAAAGAHFGVYHLATAQHDTFVGLDATQRDVVKPVLAVLQWVALALAVVTAVLLVRRWRSAAVTTAIAFGSLLGGWLVVAGLLQAVPAAIYTAAHVNPNASTVQLPPIADYLRTSRDGWALQPDTQVSTRKFGNPPGSPPVAPTVSDLAADPGTLSNTLVQDPRQLPEIFGNIDKNRRAYQTYPQVSVDRYRRADGSEQTLMLGPREIEEANLPSQTFANQSFVFTHGYGVTAVSVNQVTASRDPALVLGGQPPQLSQGGPPELNVRDPRIYCGLQTTHPVVVNTNQQEFDYVGSNADQFSSYGGDTPGGLPVPGPLDRLAISINQFNGIDLFLTSATTSQSRILLHREVRERVQQLAPWLTIDSDPYVVADSASGHLAFIVDAYIQSADFPESYQDDNNGGASYMRNAVKAVVDARTCETTLYAVDMSEPITATYNDIYPGLLVPLDRMPLNLRAHLRYPEDFFSAQARVFAQAHIDPARAIDLFTKTDLFRISQESGGSSVDAAPEDTRPHYNELVLPGDTSPSFVLLQTFSPNSTGGGTSNAMTEWLAAECDYVSGSKPKLVAVPLGGSGVQGPLQFDQKLSTNTEISSEISLLNKNGSQVSLGNVIVLPFNNRSFLYVRPLYVSANGRYPQINKVLVGTQDSVSQGDTLSAALRSLFAGQNLAVLPIQPGETPGPSPSPQASPGPSPRASPGPPSTPGAGVTLTTEEAGVLSDLIRAQAAQQQDLGRRDYDAYARDVAAAQRDIDRLRQLLGGALPSPSASPSASATP